MYIRVKLRGFVSSCRWMVASPPWRRGPQVRAPWHHGGHGTVDVVGPMAPPGHESGRGGKGVYTDRRKRPLGAVLGHLCTLLRRCGQARGRRSVHRSAKMASRCRFGAFVYTVATRGSRELRCEPRRVARVPQLPWRAGGVPSVAASRLVGKTGPARVAPPLAWRLRRDVNPHKPPKSFFQCRLC